MGKKFINDTTGRVDDFSFFDYYKVDFVFCYLNFIVLFAISYKILPLYVYHYCIFIRTFLFRARFAFFHTNASLPTFICLSYFILAVPMRECLGKHLCMSSPFPKAILNGTFLFR